MYPAVESLRSGEGRLEHQLPEDKTGPANSSSSPKGNETTIEFQSYVMNERGSINEAVRNEAAQAEIEQNANPEFENLEKAD